MSVVLRRAGRADTAALCALLAASYEDNPKADPAVLAWQYWDAPFGETRSWVAEVDGEIAAHWAAVPVPLRLDGRRVRGAKGVDIATAPALRRRGLFAQVAEALLSDCREAGVEALLTHPNPSSAVAVERAGAALVGNAAAFVRPLDPAWAARRAHVPRPLAALAVRALFDARAGGQRAGGQRAEVVHGVPEGLDALWARVEGDARTGVVRDAAWWRWRYGARPSGGYLFAQVRRGRGLAGAAAAALRPRYGGRFALVCELLAVDDAAARALVRALADAARADGAHGMAAVALPGSTQAELLAGAGLRRLPRRLEPRPLRVMVAAPGGDAHAIARLPWAMAWGDLDHL